MASSSRLSNWTGWIVGGLIITSVPLYPITQGLESFCTENLLEFASKIGKQDENYYAGPICKASSGKAMEAPFIITFIVATLVYRKLDLLGSKK
jgi:hypothetical protein